MERVQWGRVRDILISVICVGIILWASWSIMGQFVHAIILLLLSMAVAFLLTPMVNFLARVLPRALATIIVYLVVLAALLLLSYALIFSLIAQVQSFSTTVRDFVVFLPKYAANLIDFLVKQKIVSQAQVDNALTQIQNTATQYAQLLVSNIVNTLLVLTDAFLNIFLVVVISFYLTLDGRRIRDSIFSVVPRRVMPHMLLFEDALNRVVGNYIRGQLTLAAIIGVLSGVGCYVFGLGNYALVIGVLAFLFETIPMVGPALASIPALAISLLLPDPAQRTISIAIYFVCVQLFESNVLGPRIVGHAVGLHPVASIMALLVFAQLFGPFGALIATPIVAAGWVVIASIYRSARGETPEQMVRKKPAPWVVRPSAKAGGERKSTQDADPKLESKPLARSTSATPGAQSGSTGKRESMDLLRSLPTAREQQTVKEDAAKTSESEESPG